MMKAFIKNLLFILLAGVVNSVAQAQQSVSFEGFVAYEFDIKEAPEALKQQLKQTMMAVWVKGKEMKVSLELPHSVLSTLTNLENDEGFFFIETKEQLHERLAKPLGGKPCVYQEEAHRLLVPASKEANSNNDGKKKVVYTKETKEILGHLCRKAIITLDNGEEVYAYLATDIDLPKNASHHIDFQFYGIEGLPLEYEVLDEQGRRILVRATHLEAGEVKPAVFKLPSQYERTTPDKLAEMTTELYHNR
jgi:GLPGLI family protein